MVGSSFLICTKFFGLPPKERSTSSRLVKPPMCGPNFGVWLMAANLKVQKHFEGKGGHGHIKIII
jgi:hypothetical protein